VIKHLSSETIVRLEKHQLKGKAFADAVLHLNSCSECRQKLGVPDKEEVLKSIFGEDSSNSNDKDEESSKKDKPSGKQSWLEKIRNILKANKHLISLSFQTV
jgi:hypothetical protein